MILRHLIFAFCDSLWLLCASYLLAGMVIVFYYIGTSLLVNTIARREVRATAQTLLVLMGSGLGPMFGNSVAGFIASRSGDNLRLVFLFAAGMAGLATLVILGRGSRLNQGHHED